MKKIVALICIMCSFSVHVGARDTKLSQAQAEDQEKHEQERLKIIQTRKVEQKRKELIRKRIQLIAKYPLKNHWTNLQWVIYNYLSEVGNQIRDEVETIEIPLDERQFAGFVHDVLIKLSMPSVTDEERDEVLKTITEYLSQEGHLVRLINYLELRENSEETQVIDTLRFMITKLEEIKEKIETTRIEKA